MILILLLWEDDKINRLKDKVCIIMGANSGFGEAMTNLFAEEGGLIIATDFNP